MSLCLSGKGSSLNQADHRTSGETVQIKNGSIYINGELLKAQDGLGEATIAGAAEYPVELGRMNIFSWETTGNQVKTAGFPALEI